MSEPKYRWKAQDDGEGLFVAWGDQGCPNDDSMPVYLSVEPAQRERAAEVIARALNRARIQKP